MATALPDWAAAELAKITPPGTRRADDPAAECARTCPHPRRVRVAEGVYQRVSPKTGLPVAGRFEYTYRDATRRQIWQTAKGTTKADAHAERMEIRLSNAPRSTGGAEASSHTEPDDLVFCTRTGRGRRTGHVSNAFRAAARRAGVSGDGRICLHGLRHRYASMLIGAGIDVVYVARQLGHSDPRITLSTYAHYFAAADHASATRTAIDTHHHSYLVGPMMETAVVTDDGCRPFEP